MPELARRLARIPDWAWLDGDRRRLDPRPRLARARDDGPVRLRRRAHLLGAGAKPRGHRLVRRPRGADERLQPALPRPARTRDVAHRRAADRVRPGEGAELARHVARGGAGLAHRPPRQRAVALAPRRRARGGAPVARLHGDHRDREPLLPRRARRRVVAPARARAAVVAARRAPRGRARRRARDALAGARVPRGGRARAVRAGARRARPAAPPPVRAPARRRRRALRARGRRPARAGPVALRPPRRLQRRRRGWLRRRRRPALLALARRGADAVRRRRPDRSC